MNKPTSCKENKPRGVLVFVFRFNFIYFAYGFMFSFSIIDFQSIIEHVSKQVISLIMALQCSRPSMIGGSTNLWQWNALTCVELSFQSISLEESMEKMEFSFLSLKIK